jgi:hypothetical protein
VSCLCGATDCERCHPGSTRWVTCSHCGVRAQMCDTCGWDIGRGDDEGVCDDCLAADEAEANGGDQ